MLLVINAGPSSIKLAMSDAALAQVLTGSVTEIDGQGGIKIGDVDHNAEFSDHAVVLDARMCGRIFAFGCSERAMISRPVSFPPTKNALLPPRRCVCMTQRLDVPTPVAIHG